MNDIFCIAGQELCSRLFIGTGKYPSLAMIPEILKVANPGLITVAIRRINHDNKDFNIMEYIAKDVRVMPNTSGARTAEEAVRLAELCRAAGCGDWIKLEIIQDQRYLLPDGYESAKATEILAKKGFTVLPYMNADLYVGEVYEMQELLH